MDCRPMTFNDTGNCLLVSDELTDSSDATLEMTLLPADYILADSDVLCGRGKKCFKHVGNEIFRTMVQESLRSYAVAPTKTEKTFIIRAVINRVRARSPNGGFVKHDPLTGRYYEVGETMAREKTSQAFRDALYGMYKSSCAAKMRRRLKEKPSVPSFSSPSSDVNLIPDLHAPSIGLAMPLNVDTSFPSEIYQVQTTNSLRDDLKAITELAEASCNNRNAFQDMNQFFSHECNSAVSSIGQSLEQKMQAMLQSCNGQQSQEILKTQPQNLSLSSILAGGNPSVTPPEVPSSQLIDHNRSTALPRRGSLQWEKLLMLAGRKINYDDDPFEPIPL